MYNPDLSPNDETRGTPVWVLLSGGLDSAACVGFYTSQAHVVRGIHIDYGQVAAFRERQAAVEIARHYQVPLTLLEWRGGQTKAAGEIVGRNAFLVLASFMEIGESRGIIATGLHAGTPYFDCSEGFLSLMQKVVDGYSGGRIRIAAPFVRWSKREVWDYCVINNVPISQTYSCELGADQPCRTCRSCRDTEALRALQNIHD